MQVQFSDEIEFEMFEIENARDAVVYSFIVQKSLMYLDLNACEYTMYPKSVFTEEQCRKLMEPGRQILYTYHLDLPERLERSLRSSIHNADDQEQFEAFHLGVMTVCEFVHTRNLGRYVMNHILFSINKKEKLRRYLNVIKLLNLNQSRETSMLLFDNFTQALFPYCSDSNLVLEFAITFDFFSWIFEKECPILIGYILHHAMQLGYKLWLASETGLDPINGCIIFRTPGNISMLLAYGTLLHFQPQIYLAFIDRRLENRILQRIAGKNIPGHRLFLVLQLYYYFTVSNRYSDGLLYIWRSIPEPYISRNEICTILGFVVSPRKLYNMREYYKFYIVEGIDEIINEVPRSLQHLCRVAVRSALNRNHQLPYGINQLGKPQCIIDYLKLKC